MVALNRYPLYLFALALPAVVKAFDVATDSDGCARLQDGHYAFVHYISPTSSNKHLHHTGKQAFQFGPDRPEAGAKIVTYPEGANAPDGTVQEFFDIPGRDRGTVPAVATWEIRRSLARPGANLYSIINRSSGLALTAGDGENSLIQAPLDTTGSERNDNWCFEFGTGRSEYAKDDGFYFNRRNLVYTRYNWNWPTTHHYYGWNWYSNHPARPVQLAPEFEYIKIKQRNTGRVIKFSRRPNTRQAGDLMRIGTDSGNSLIDGWFFPRRLGDSLPFPRVTSAPTPPPTPSRAPSPPACAAENVTCANGETCCGTLICQNTDNGAVCLFPPTRSPPTSPTSPTSPTAPTTPTPPTGICQSRGRSCDGRALTCCSGLTCQNTNFGNLCRPPTGIFPPTFPTAPAPLPPTAFCQSRGRQCGNSVSCCGGLSCQATNFGNLCRPTRRVSPPRPPPPAPVPGATFDTLLFLVGPSCANIASDLTGVTVFGPTDAAFANFFSSNSLTTSSLCGSAIDSLSAILTYHVVPGSITGADIRELIPNTVDFETLFGETIAVDAVNLTVNGVKISIPDALSSSYVLHGIDDVLLPPGIPGFV